MTRNFRRTAVYGTLPAQAAAVTRNLGHPFWTTPLTASTPVAATSTSMVSRLTAQYGAVPGGSPLNGWYAAPYQTITNQDAYSLPIYRAPASQPRVPVWSRRDKGPLRAVLDAGVPVPDPTQLPGNRIGAAGTDSSCIIIQGDTAWEFWQFGPAEAGIDPPGYAWKCEQGGVLGDIRSHPGIWSGSSFFGGGSNGRPEGYDWGVSAAGFSYLGLLLKWEDWAAADILHPIALTLQLTGGADGEPSRLLPATRNDSGNLTNSPDTTANPYRIPEAARFRLPAGFDIPGWVAAHALPTAGANGTTAAILGKVLRCLRDFGMIVIDTGGVTAFSAEASSTFGTPYNTLSATAPDWGNFGQQVPWSSLLQVAAPTVDISAPTDTTGGTVTSPPPSTGFLTTSGQQVLLNGRPWRGTGVDLPWSMGCGAEVNLPPTLAQHQAMFAAAKPNSIYRIWIFGGTDLTKFDALLTAARPYGHRFIPVLSDYQNGCGEPYAGPNPGGFLNGGWATGGWRDNWLTPVINRYRSEPLIGWWEWINEPSLSQTTLRPFFDQVGAYVRNTLGDTHLIGTGTMSEYGNSTAMRNVNASPYVDLCSQHEYDQTEMPSHWTSADNADADFVGKPWYVGESGIDPAHAAAGSARAAVIKGKIDALHTTWPHCAAYIYWSGANPANTRGPNFEIGITGTPEIDVINTEPF